MKHVLRGTVALALTAGLTQFAPDANAKTVKLVVAAPAPAPVTYVAMFKKMYIPEVNKRLAASGKDFKIEWIEAYGQAIAKANETFEAVGENIAQVGLLVKNFEESKLPLEQYPVMAPFSGESEEQIVQIDANLRKKIPAMNEAYKKHGLTFTVSGVSPQYDLFTTFPVKSIDDLKGKKIGVSGVLGQWLRGIGAVPVSSAMVESYTSIRSGVYDGYPISINLAFPFKTYEAAKYQTEVHLGVSTSPALAFNTETWNALPAHARKIISDIAPKWPQWQITEDAKRRAKFIGIMKKKGVKFSTMSMAERKRWANTLPNIAQQWAARLEKRGLPGRALLKAYMDELHSMNIQMLRDWSKS